VGGGAVELGQLLAGVVGADGAGAHPALDGAGAHRAQGAVPAVTGAHAAAVADDVRGGDLRGVVIPAPLFRQPFLPERVVRLSCQVGITFRTFNPAICNHVCHLVPPLDDIEQNIALMFYVVKKK
jgi:hypothetical protein